MKKNLLLSILFLLTFTTVFSQSVNKKTIKKTTTEKKQIVSCNEKTTEETLALRKKHSKFLGNSPFKKIMSMSNSQRKEIGLTPNKYYESEWELTMNPELGRPTTENLTYVRKKLESDQLANRTPGDASDNPWIERGPTNVGGRTRAIMFDPNDSTGETVFAGGVSGGLWKNTNITNPNSVWINVNMPQNLAVSCITYDPNNTNIFYLGTGETYVAGDANGDGVWKSVNGGLTWTNVLGGISGPTFFQSSTNLTINSPASVAGTIVAIATLPANFGVAVTTPITSDIVLVDPVDGCTALTNGAAISGKIALIRRGSCNFSVKVKFAQDNGATGVLMINNTPGNPTAMGGTDATIVIPSEMISRDAGNALVNALLLGPVNVTMTPSVEGVFSGNLVPGIQHINAIKVRNNAGISEVYVAAGDGFYSAGSDSTYLGATTYGLYKSVDSGANWNPLTLPLTLDNKPHCPNDIEITSDNKIWVSTINSNVYRDGGGKVFSSSDGGSTFVDKFTVPSGLRTQIAISNSNPDKIYVISELRQPAVPTIETQIFKTTDSFATTTVLAQPIDSQIAPRFTTYGFTGQQAGYDLLFEVDPSNDEIIYAGGIDNFRSADGGTTWNQISKWNENNPGDYSYVHSDQHALTFRPGNSNKAVFGNDGGIFYAEDLSNAATSSAVISSRNVGYNVTQFYSVGVAPTFSVSGLTDDHYVAGAQDNGTQYFGAAPAGANPSLQVQGGDGAISHFDQGTDKYYITNYVYNQNINLRLTTGGSKVINSESVNSGGFIAIMALDSNLDALYADYTNSSGTIVNKIRRYTNIKAPGTVGKVNLTNALFNSAPTAITVSKYTVASTTLLVGTRNSRLLKVANANGSAALAVWTEISGPNFVGSISDVEYGASENEIFVTFHNYGVVSIWYTSDAGATWQNKEGNFPDIPVKSILQNPLLANEVIIGTDLGVWGTTNFNDASPVWIRSDNGMKNVRVTDMDLRNDNIVYAATYGRGVFSGSFTNPLANTAFSKENKNVNLFPNPTKGQFSLNIKDYSGKVVIQIIDVNGKLINSINDDNFNTQKNIDVSNLQTGIYIVKATGDNLRFTEKLIVN